MDIKERCPMDYMPYMEEHFWRATGLRLNGLRDFMAWIKQGSYYHGLVAQQGHLHKCPHLAGALLPRQPQITPSESCQESQKQAETPATSSSEPSIGATATPVAETPATQTPVAQAPATCSDPLLPWRQEEWVMASHGPNELRLAQMRNLRRIGLQSVASPNPGGTNKDRCFPSHSKTVRGGSPQFHSSTSMWESSLPPTTMWQVEGLCISIQRCCRERPCALEIRSPA